MESELQELLREKAEEMQLAPEIPRPVLRRARRRRAMVGAMTGGVVALFVLLAFIGVRAAFEVIESTPGAQPSVHRPLPSSPETGVDEWRGIWPFTTRAEAEAVQASVDVGKDVWLVDLEAFISSYAQSDLGLNGTFFDAGVDLADSDNPGPIDVVVYSCDPSGSTSCSDPVPMKAIVTAERLVRRDATGIWAVTAVDGPQPFTPRPHVLTFSRDPCPGRTGDLSSFVGLTDNRRIDLVDVSTGGVVCTIAEISDPNVSFADLELAPGGQDLYWTLLGPGCSAKVMRASIEGDQLPVEVAAGEAPAASIDGGRLAFVDAWPCADPDFELVVVDLSSGDEARWVLGGSADLPKAGPNGVCRIAWINDTLLAFNVCHEEGADLFIVDTATEGGIDLRDARAIEGPRGGSLTVVGRHSSSGGVVVLEGPRLVEDDLEPRVVALDLSNGAVVATILAPAPSNSPAVRIDDEGRRVIYLVYVGEGTQVWMTEEGQKATAGPEGFYEDVDW